jgi:hypothetical protein
MSENQVVATWLCFIGTAIQKRLGITRAAYLDLAKRYKLVTFLFKNYELLHYYDNDYIVSDVLKYIEEQGGAINA